MKGTKTLFMILFAMVILGILPASAIDGTEVLRSDQKDKVTIQYNISERNGNTTVYFSNVRKEVSIENSEKYKDNNNVQVVFFERTGDYQGAEFTLKNGVNIRPLKINRDELIYKRSQAGFIRLGDSPEISVELLTDKEVTLNIPIYLAYYKKKRQYEVFAYCGELSVKFPPRKHSGNTSGGQKQLRTKTITEEVEAEKDLSPTDIAKNVLGNADEYINNPDVTPDDLKDYIRKLDDMRYNIQDGAISSEISKVILACKKRLNELTQKELDEKEHSVEQTMLRQQKEKAQQDMDYVNERISKIDDLSDSDLGDLRAASNELRKQSYAMKDKDEALAAQMTQTADNCDQKLKEIEDGKKRRNIWLIVGGILLMVLMFVGNQTFNHFRNLKNQKGIENMQKTMAKRAQDEARRRAQSMARSRINKVQREIRQKSRDTVRKGVNSAIKGAKGKNNKGISI